MKHFILGTAGHIDHGKTALVKALTGTDTDRLPEEKKRGITIDIGFANLRIDDYSFGVVDVPGHEDFIRNMLAGATGMDIVLLVVAADEGIMPQTREHLAILDLLGVTKAVVAVTKSDLADEDWVALVADEVRTLIAPTSLRAAAVVPVSAVTGIGLLELKAAIVEQTGNPTDRDHDDVFRMPVDRVFTVRGTGTVVTGTVWSGHIHVDDAIQLLPANLRARVRGIQVHDVSVQSAGAGERAAIALSGVERDAVRRGEVAICEDGWLAARMLTLRVRMVAGTEWQLKTRQRVHVHLGTAEVRARILLLDRDILVDGDSGWVQLRLETPLVARVGDRVVLRSYSPVTTIAGGVVAEISARKRTRLAAEDATALTRIIEDGSGSAVQHALLMRGPTGMGKRELSMHTPCSPADVTEALMSAEAVVIGERWFAADVVTQAVDDVVSAADRFHAGNPLLLTFSVLDLQAGLRQLSRPLVEYAVAHAVARGDLVAHGSRFGRRGFAPSLTARQQKLRAALLEELATAGLAPPALSELENRSGNDNDVALLLRLLESENRVVRVGLDFYLDRDQLNAAIVRVRQELGGRAGLGASEFRAALPVSRRHLIPLLEYFDRIGITIRDGDLRSLPTT